MIDSRRKIIEKVVKIGKYGLTVIADVGAFYYKSQKEKLVDLETSLPTHFTNLAYNGICVYNQTDFNLLSEKQRNDIIKHHSIAIKLEPLQN